MARIGRNRLPPDVIRCLATSGIIVTSDPVRDRIAALTRSMSAVTSSISLSIDLSIGAWPWDSNGTTTAKIFTPEGAGQNKHRNAMLSRQGRLGADIAFDRRVRVGDAGADAAVDQRMSRRKPAPDLIGGGCRFVDKDANKESIERHAAGGRIGGRTRRAGDRHAPAHRRAGALLQRGGRDRPRRWGFSR